MNIFQKIKERYKIDEQKRLDRRVNAMYQLKERNGELWLIYEGFYVCPCSMLAGDPIESVKKMRMLYRMNLHNA